MKKIKLLVATAVLTTLSTMANADEINKNEYFAGPLIGAIVTGGSQGTSSSAVGVHGGVRHYFTDKVSVEGDMAYVYSNGSSLYIPTVSVGYDFGLKNGITLRPKIGIGYYKEFTGPDTSQNMAYKLGLETIITKKLSVDAEYTNLQINMPELKSASFVSVSLNYKF